MKFKAALFDLDGTLLDTIEDLTDSMNAALLRLGLPGHDAQFYKAAIGEGVANWVCRSLPGDEKHEELVSKCMQFAREEYSKRWEVKTKPFDGVRELLRELEGHGVKLAILSNKPQDFTELNVERFLNGHNFDSIVGATDGAPKKPDPTLALKIAKDMGIAPHECVFVGDSSIDMLTARAAGMYPVGVLWGFRSKEEIISNGAAVVIAKPLELLRVFGF